MKESYLINSLLFCLSSLITLSVHCQHSPDVSVMKALKISLGNPTDLNWSDPNPCNWDGVRCLDSRVTGIQISYSNLKGVLPPDLKNLTSLIVLDVEVNELSGPIPNLSGLSSLEEAYFMSNNFSYIPSDFFQGLTSLKTVSLSENPFSFWEIPESLKDAKHLQDFHASHAGMSGTIPHFFGGDTFPKLRSLLLSANNLQGQIPPSFDTLSLRILRLDNNRFTGPLPDLSRHRDLLRLFLNDNEFTGVVPISLVNLPMLGTVYLANNFLQGPTPVFNNSTVYVDIGTGSNSFCVGEPGVGCDSRVNILLSIAESVNYPAVFAQSWKGNEPCTFSQKWKGIYCDNEGNIIAVNFGNLGLSGTISSNFSMLKSLEKLILSNNSLTGIIPNELATLSRLEKMDVSNNQLHGEVPNFRQNVTVNTSGNPAIGRDGSFPSVGTPLGEGGRKSSKTQAVVGTIIVVVFGLFVVGLGVYLCTRKPKCLTRFFRRSNAFLICHWDDNNGNAAKIITSGWSVKGVEFGNMTIIPIQVLRNATNNFNEENMVGRGGFGTVYKGELNGTIIAVKRMKTGVMDEQGMGSFKCEIEVLTKVRHRHLLALIGYCLDGNERLLVYEYMPQGTLHRYLFKWNEQGLKPLEWSKRLTIALDVARGVEYLHGLANQCFIHRDLKPSNILLGDDMRAKVADFGLVRLVPDNVKSSIETRIAGTFGYLAPEYVVTGRVTTKVDVFSFGVILMELITGRKAVDHTTSHSEDVVHLVTWFRDMHINHYTFQGAIDQTIELDGETVASISRVAELAVHCCASDPHKRPDMGYVVSALSSLADLWRPLEVVHDNKDGTDLHMTSTPNSHSSTSESFSSADVVMMESHHSLHDDLTKD